MQIYNYINYLIIAIAVIFMGWLFWSDIKSHEGDSHRDFKSVIVSAGVLGTFLGILVGLWGFDSDNISDSVPLLLEGLKTAFITSIVGMFLAVFLSVIQKKRGRGDDDDEDHLSVLSGIGEKLDRLSEIQKHTKYLEAIPLINTKLDSIDTNVKTLSNDISSVKDELRQNQEKLSKLLTDKLEAIDGSLKEAVKTLAKGATEEIIKALENVIGDFNKNLTEQFGENFKQLNEAVMKMIAWQENYKESIQKFESSLTAMLSNTENSHQKTVDSINQSFEKFSKTNQAAIDSTVSKIQTATEKSTEHLKEHTESLLGTVKEANLSMHNVMQKQSELATESNEKAKEMLLVSLKEMLSNTENSHQKTVDSINQSFEKFSETNQVAIDSTISKIQTATEKSTEHLKEHTESLLGTVQEANSSMHNVMQKQSELATESNEKAKEMLLVSLKKMLSNTENSHQKTVDSINQSFEKFSETNQIAIDSTISKIQTATEKSTEHLKEHTESLLGTVQEANSSMHNAMQKQSELATENNEKTKEMQLGLEESLAVTKENANQIKEITGDYKTIAAVSGDLKGIIETNQNQIQNLEVHFESLKKVGQDASQITVALQDFSKTIQGSLNEQADSVATLTKNIEEQLPRALEQLEGSLTSITQEFATRYEEFLEHYEKLQQRKDAE